jgi:light-regulated signal transduction histidine kinase (bacteriophytochrome)
VPLAFERPDYLLFFRREQIVLATWAGNPSDLRSDPTPDGRNPRASFAAWKRDIRNLSRAWEIEDVQVADELAAAVREIDGGQPRASAYGPPRAAVAERREPAPAVTAFTRRIVRISTP